MRGFEVDAPSSVAAEVTVVKCDFYVRCLEGVTLADCPFEAVDGYGNVLARARSEGMAVALAFQYAAENAFRRERERRRLEGAP